MARTTVCTPYYFEFQSYITGHHICKNIWTPILEEKLATVKEKNNPHDKFAVAVVKDDQIVGHMPKDISKLCASVLLSGGKINCTVTGKRENKRKNGLEVPCGYQVRGPKHRTEKIQCMIEEHLLRTK